MPAFSRGMLKELHFKGSGRVHVAFGSASPRFGVEAACVSSWSGEATRAEPGLPARIGTRVTQPGPHSIPSRRTVPPKDSPGPRAVIPCLQVSACVNLGTFLPLSRAVRAGGCCVPWAVLLWFSRTPLLSHLIFLFSLPLGKRQVTSNEKNSHLNGG